MKKLFLPLVLMLVTSACGFHLRGTLDVPLWLNNISIISKEDNKELASLLKAQLEGYKIQVNHEPSLAKYWLIINDSTYQQKIISIGASTNPRQYQLILSVEFMLKTRKGEIIKPPSQATATRQLTVNNDRILGSNDEETVLIKEMKQDIVIQIINRLSRLGTNAEHAVTH